MLRFDIDTGVSLLRPDIDTGVSLLIIKIIVNYTCGKIKKKRAKQTAITLIRKSLYSLYSTNLPANSDFYIKDPRG